MSLIFDNSSISRVMELKLSINDFVSLICSVNRKNDKKGNFSILVPIFWPIFKRSLKIREFFINAIMNHENRLLPGVAREKFLH